MPVRAQAVTMHFFATNSDGPVTGQDYTTLTLKVVKDGTVGAVSASPTEVDSTNAPGIYKVALTAAENTADVVTLCGKSSTSGVTISPSTWTNISNVAAVNGETSAAVAQAAGASTIAVGTVLTGSTEDLIKLHTDFSSVDDFYNNKRLIFTDGALAGQSRLITDYVGSTRVATIDPGNTSAAGSGDGCIVV